ncbi:MAG: PhzF family phenazine biosynthesis protein [Gemmatimonadaceae bacterium]
MRTYAFVTVDVFTDRRFGGNPLAVFPDAQGLSDVEMQALATELNLSETTFVLPPEKPEHTARVRIFTRTAELPFAGHPNVGTAFVLATGGRVASEPLAFEERAGLVTVELQRDTAAAVVGATIEAPRPLFLGEEVPANTVARCVGLASEDVLVTTHAPVWASVGNPFVIAEVTPEALRRAVPDLRQFRDAIARRPTADGRWSIFVYARDGSLLRARMFAPLSGTIEDPATGSANAPLGALLLARGSGDHASYEIMQGVEMGRPSLLHVTARRAADGIRATVGGRCVPVFQGEVTLD